MEKFGKRWLGYTEKIRKNWEAVVAPKDTVVIPGDISWAMKLEDSLEDFKFLDALPGKKIILKGNHDLWWSSMKKINEFFAANNIKTNFHEVKAYENKSLQCISSLRKDMVVRTSRRLQFKNS